jgi:outer membrane immunogenic protein
LLYGKGGVAWAGDKYSAFDAISGLTFAASETRTGWTAGVGVEWAFWTNWSAFLEYDFYGFGHRNVSFTCTDSTGALCGLETVTIKQDINAVKFGINYRFNWGKGPGPVVARY